MYLICGTSNHVKTYLRIIGHRYPVAGIFTILVLTGLWLASTLKFDHDRRRFFPADNMDLELTTKFFDEIEQDDIIVLLGLELNGSVLDSTNLVRIEQLVGQLEEIPLVDKALSVTNFQYLKKAGPSVYAARLISPFGSRNRESDSLRIAENPYVLGNLVSRDYTATNIILKSFKLDHQEKADALYAAILSKIERSGFTYHLAGFPIIQSVTVARLHGELFFYTALSGILLVIILLVVYRSLRGLLVPMLTLIATFSIFFAYLSLSGQTLDLMSSLFPILMLIFSISDVVHLQTHYFDQLGKGNNPLVAMESTLREIGFALLLTSFTTAVGFATLSTSRIAAVRQFGINAAIGVVIAFVVTVVFSVAFLLFFKKKTETVKHRDDGWAAAMQWLYQTNKSKHKLILGLFLAACLLSISGIMQVNTNTYIKGDIPNREKLKLDFEYFERVFGGVRSFELAVLPTPGHTLRHPDVLFSVAQVEGYLTDSIGVKNIVSPTLPIRFIHHAYTRGRSQYAFPTDTPSVKRYIAMGSLASRAQVKNLENKDGTMGRVSGRMADLGSDLNEVQLAKFNRWMKSHIDPDLVSFVPVGTTLLYDRNHEYLRQSLFRTLGLALLIVGVLFALIFRDYRMVIVSMLPNIVPLLFAAAAMGFLNIKLQSITSIFFAISFGIAVDDTIHFLTRYKLERKKGKTVDKAMLDTTKISGKAMILTSLILIVAFSTLMFSNFNGTFYIGVLMSITLFTALLADLFLLPQLLYYINRKRLRRPLPRPNTQN